MKMYLHRIGFDHYVLLTTTNLRTWNLDEDHNCKLCSNLEPAFINFEKQGTSASSNHISKGLLVTLESCKFEEAVTFPPEVASTNFRPVNLLLYMMIKQMVLLVLTVSWKEKMEKAHERENVKYQPLIGK